MEFSFFSFDLGNLNGIFTRDFQPRAKKPQKKQNDNHSLFYCFCYRCFCYFC